MGPWWRSVSSDESNASEAHVGKYLPGISLLALMRITVCTLAGWAAYAGAQTGAAAPADKYAWLEDIYGEKPLAWVKEHDARTAAVLEKDPRFAQFQADALKVLDSPDRLA